MPKLNQDVPQTSQGSGLLTLYAVLLGSSLGLFAPSIAELIPSQIGWLFIRTLKLIAPPLVLFACLNSLLSLGDMSRLKQLGGRAALYYLSTSLLAALAGVGMTLLLVREATYQAPESLMTAPPLEGGRFLEKLIPSDLISPLLNGEVLQLITMGICLALLILHRPAPERETFSRAAYLIDVLINDAARALLWLTPLAALSITAELTRTLNWAELAPFKSFLWAWGSATLIHSVITLPLLFWALTRLSPWQFFMAVKEAVVIALTTASSAGTLPASKRVLEEHADVSQESASFILPLGATINMDGSALYQAQLLLFMCVAEGRSLTLTLMISIVGLVLFSSAGTSAIPRGGIAMMGMMIAFLDLPPLYLGLYIAIDQILDYPITAVNVWGDLMGTKIIDQQLKRKNSLQEQPT